jgi:hypothetical protein
MFVLQHTPVFPTSLADMRDMLRIVASAPRDENQVDREAFVDQKPHETVIVWTGRRVRRTGL